MAVYTALFTQPQETKLVYSMDSLKRPGLQKHVLEAGIKPWLKPQPRAVLTRAPLCLTSGAFSQLSWLWAHGNAVCLQVINRFQRAWGWKVLRK